MLTPKYENIHSNTDSMVSAVVITHNRLKLVKKAIDSVQKQTYLNIELIVVDDASEDSTRDILEEIAKDKKIIYIYISKEESKGGNYARNIGIKNAHGKYIAFLDDDDEWLPEKTKKEVDFLETHPDFGVVSCLKVFEYNQQKTELQNDQNIPEGDVHIHIFESIPYITSTIMIRKDILDQCGLFDENLRFWQEYELSIRYAQITKVGLIHEHLCLYRIISNDKNRLTNKLEGWEEAVSYIEEKHKTTILALPRESQNGWELVKAFDGYNRAFAVKNKIKANEYGKKIYQYKHKPGTFLHYRMGFSMNRIVGLLLKQRDAIRYKRIYFKTKEHIIE